MDWQAIWLSVRLAGAHTLLARPSYDDIRLRCHVLFGVTGVSATFLLCKSS